MKQGIRLFTVRVDHAVGKDGACLAVLKFHHRPFRRPELGDLEFPERRVLPVDDLPGWKHVILAFGPWQN